MIDFIENQSFTCTIDGLCGWDICTLTNFCPRSKGWCFDISMGLMFISDEKWWFCDWIGWKADDAVWINDLLVGCGVDFNELFVG